MGPAARDPLRPAQHPLRPVGGPRHRLPIPMEPPDEPVADLPGRPRADHDGLPAPRPACRLPPNRPVHTAPAALQCRIQRVPDGPAAGGQRCGGFDAAAAPGQLDSAAESGPG